MPKSVRAFTITPKEAAHILERRAIISLALKRSLVEYVVEHGSKTDIMLIIGLCEKRQLKRAMRRVEPCMNTRERIECLKNLRESINRLSPICENLVGSILSAPIWTWFGGDVRRDVWYYHSDILSEKDIDRMVECVLKFGDAEWAHEMLLFRVMRCTQLQPFLPKFHQLRLVPLADKYTPAV